MQMNATVHSNNNEATGCKVETTTVKQQQKFMCRAQEFYNVMTTPEVSNLIIFQYHRALIPYRTLTISIEQFILL